jgi:hypothetical protein
VPIGNNEIITRTTPAGLRSLPGLPCDPAILLDPGIVRTATTATAQGVVGATATATGCGGIVSATTALGGGADIVCTASTTDMTDWIVRAAPAANVTDWIVGTTARHSHTGGRQHGNGRSGNDKGLVQLGHLKLSRINIVLSSGQHDNGTASGLFPTQEIIFPYSTIHLK